MFLCVSRPFFRLSWQAKMLLPMVTGYSIIDIAPLRCSQMMVRVSSPVNIYFHSGNFAWMSVQIAFDFQRIHQLRVPRLCPLQIQWLSEWLIDLLTWDRSTEYRFFCDSPLLNLKRFKTWRIFKPHLALIELKMNQLERKWINFSPRVKIVFFLHCLSKL